MKTSDTRTRGTAIARAASPQAEADSAPVAPRVHILWHRTLPEVLRLGADWDGLLRGWGPDSPFFAWTWIRPWLGAYRNGSLRFGLILDGQVPIGMIPLQHVRVRLPAGPVLRSIRLAGDGPLCPDHLVLPFAPGREQDCAEAVADALWAERSTWDRIELKDLLEEHPGWPALARALRERGLRVELRPRTRCPFIPLPDSWEAYLGSLGSSTRAKIRTGLNRLEKKLAVTFQEPGSIAEVDDCMDHLERLHQRVWQRRGQRGVFADPRFRLFHRLHARRAFRDGRLWLVSMRTEGRVIGVFLGFLSGMAGGSRGGATGHYYQLGHDPDYARYSVGQLLIASCIRRGIEGGFREVDLLRGAGEFKYHLTQRERRGHDLVARRGTWPDRTAGALESLIAFRSRIARRLLGLGGVARLKRLLRRP